jgi:predicted ATPase
MFGPDELLIKLLPPHALLKRLQQNLQILASSLQHIPLRQQTLHNTFTWSYELLTVQEQQLFRILSAFVGGCTLEAAEVLCVALAHGEKLQRTHEPRLFMLDTIRTYGLECLAILREETLIQQVHAAYYLTLAEESEPGLTGTEQRYWLA